MNDQYLWDRSGEPDADVAELEAKLQPLRWSGAPMRAHAPGPRTNRTFWTLAAAAAIVVVLVGTALWAVRRQPETAWQSAERRIRRGDTLVTGEQSRIVLHADDVGRVEIAPRSVVRVLESSASREQFELRRGTLHALIWAPPALFQVDTPSSRAIDLGCQYTLSVDDKGAGFLQVETGWVAFEHDRLESFIPAGAACRTTPGRGPGVPFFADATETLRRSLALWEAHRVESDLDKVLVAARSRDGLTVWHLLPRVPPPDRGKVYDRLAVLVNLSSVDRAQALELKRTALDAAWNSLKLENTDWWREWKRRW